ncbi:hypothetical protein MAPG_11118 [Magnaporthiopsis poae ATCC 64411]|uniref:SET domain-containing protein n=1 Tax=Magnaporthiopsis poae (strain ATCC 64411 / 73-15) TaxID=644358 RepID=A0A0C4EEE5_MAGP6|nr:hypothetical protein MAPG_11118 [Magnaporthiopsis poae ATCC 64411]
MPTLTPGKLARILPKNWPEDVPYLYAPRHSPALTGSQLAAIRVPPAQPASGAAVVAVPHNLRRGPCAAVQIRTITDPRHPAVGQRGLFAARRLEPGALILPYLGEVHPGTVGVDDDAEHQPQQQHSHAESDYDLWLSRDADVAVDAARCGNEARFVNDYRGVPGAERANAEFREVWDPRPQPRPRPGSCGPPGGCGAAANESPSVHATGEWTMAVFVLPVGKKALAKQQQKQQQQKRGQRLGVVAGGGRRERPLGGINEGEEILVSYGKGFWEKRKQEDEARSQEEQEQVQEALP